jgi:8-oxo-dGTP pyrophosphatase MutT (NUDIX family)
MSLSSLRERLIDQLEPAAAWTPGRPPARSDFDLNPGAERPERILRPAAVLIPVIAGPEGATVLMTRRSDSLASHTGQIAFPGGRLDPGETAVEAALREAFEEVALDPALVEVLGVGDAYETGTGFLVTPVVGWLTARPTTTPSPDEVAEVFEVPWDFLMDPSNHSRDSYDSEGQPRRWYWSMTHGQRYIWGVTAGIIANLVRRLA